MGIVAVVMAAVGAFSMFVGADMYEAEQDIDAYVGF